VVIVVGSDRWVIVDPGVDAAARRGCFRFWNVDDPGSFERTHLNYDWLDRRATACRVLIGAEKPWS
jgi:hypothetical protein